MARGPRRLRNLNLEAQDAVPISEDSNGIFSTSNDLC
jgi:hypothetical protein